MLMRNRATATHYVINCMAKIFALFYQKQLSAAELQRILRINDRLLLETMVEGVSHEQKPACIQYLQRKHSTNPYTIHSS